MAIKPDPTRPERIPLRGYVMLNAVFWLICLIFLAASHFFLKQNTGISIFFIALAAGFTLVSLFDFLCTVLSPVPEKNDSTDRAGE